MLIDVSKMSQKAVFDLVTVGHFVLDTIITPNATEPRQALGGPPTYVSVAAAKLGAQVSVISKVGGDFPKEYVEWLGAHGVDLSGLKKLRNAVTTRFALEYNMSWERRLRLETCAPPISVADVPKAFNSEIVHIAPIANEISHNVILRLRQASKVLSLDPQGFVRSFDKRGNVGLERWNAAEVLSRVDVFKSAAKEIEAMTGNRHMKEAIKQTADYGIKIVLVTRGLKGSTLFFESKFYDIPAYESKTVVDPTGAGDSFIGAFLAEYLRSKDALWCSCVGSAAASFVVEGIGPERFGESHEVYERAQRIYGKVAR